MLHCDTHIFSILISYQCNSCMLVLVVIERCVGFIMAKMVVRELMDPVLFSKFKAFLTQVYMT